MIQFPEWTATRWWRLVLAWLPSCWLSLDAQLSTPSSPTRREPSRYQFETDASGTWFRAPDGSKFFSVGICFTNPGTRREDYDDENPSYAAWRFHPTPLDWARRTTERLHRWKFTTLGAWSDFETLSPASSNRFHYTPVLHAGSTAGAPWWDMWDPANVRRMRQVARDQIAKVQPKSRVIGYFSDNELGWWNATLWKMTWEHPPSSGQRRRLVNLVKAHYADDWKAMVQDFDPEKASNWKELSRRGMLYRKPGAGGIRVMRRFLGLMAGRYYELMREVILEADPGALYRRSIPILFLS